MKRVLKCAVSAAVIAGMSLMAVAAPSVNNGTIDKNQVTAAQGGQALTDGARVLLEDIILEDYPEEIQELYKKLLEQLENENADTTVTAAEILGELYDLTKIPVFDTESVLIEDEEVKAEELLEKMYFLTEIVGIEFVNVEPTEEKPVEVTFTLNNMTDTMKVYVLNYCDAHGEDGKPGWELLETTRLSKETVSAKFHATSSLIAFLYTETDEIQLPEEGVGTSPVTSGFEAETEYESEIMMGQETEAEQ